MKNRLKTNLLITFLLVILGQLVFFLISPRFLEVSHSNRIYATVGITSTEETNPQVLAEASKQFIETMVGWMKFPNFMQGLRASVKLPEGSSISAHPQERQNIIITLNSPTPIEADALPEVKDFLQAEIDEYNLATQNYFSLTKVDYEQIELKRSYKFGATVTFVITVILAFGAWFLRREISS